MAVERVLTVGLESAEVAELRRRVAAPLVAYDLPPRVQVDGRRLTVRDPAGYSSWLGVSHVAFHGIYEDDLPLIAALALWGGPCLPNARGMTDARLRVPCLVRALAVSRFNTAPRGFASAGTTVRRAAAAVAKWGEWHYGENKERFEGERYCDEPTLVEPFIAGESVRVHLCGDRAWQVRMGGDGWKRSIHGGGAGLVEPAPELVADARALRRHFGLEVMAVDYQLAADGTSHLLELNHIPNVLLGGDVFLKYLIM